MSVTETYFTPIEAPELSEIGEGYLPPNTMVHFMFGRHENGDDFAPASVIVANSDIVIPELVGWKPEQLAWFYEVSCSDPIDNLQLLTNKVARSIAAKDDTYHESLIQAIQGTHKAVLLIDASAGTELNDPNKISIGAPKSLDDALGYLYKICVATVEGSTQREKIMLENLGPFVTAMVAGHPHLSKQREVQVGVLLGAYHDTVYCHLRDSGYAKQVSASYASNLGQDIGRPVAQAIMRAIRSNQPVGREAMVKLLSVYEPESIE